jgi:hypothetical protein
MSPAEIQVVPKEEPITAMSLLQSAVDKGASIDTIERLVALQEKMLAKQAEVAYIEAMQRAQMRMEPVRRNAKNPETHSRYSTYEQLDAAVRPIYTGEGFSVSYNTTDSPLAEHMRVLAMVRHIAGHSETFQVDMPVDGKGPKGGAVMTRTHATGSGFSYGRRCLLKAIWNIAEYDDDGNAAGGASIPEDVVSEHVKRLNACANLVDLQRVFTEAYQIADKAGDKNATGLLIRTRAERKNQIKETPVGNRIAEPLAVERLNWIDDSKDIDELRRIFRNADKMAVETGDKDFQQRLVKAAKKRAEAIRAGN